MSEQSENPKTFCPMPGINAGMMTLEDLEKITELVRKYQVPMVKVTGAQRLYFQGLEPEKLAELKSELNIPDGLPHTRSRVHYVQACPGKNWCKFGVQPTEKMAKAIMGLWTVPCPTRSRWVFPVAACAAASPGCVMWGWQPRKRAGVSPLAAMLRARRVLVTWLPTV